MSRGGRTDNSTPGQRRCVVCRTVHDRHVLARYVRRDGVVTADPERRMGGRGAWVCQDARCRERAVKALPRVLERAVDRARRERVDPVRGKV